ncbi:MAG: ABC transporter ATP-binding protein [Propionibacteriaceae bacterium]|nr:ABC transporter ATP-binding protein [Propionibacteriaceae bacterium]
MTPIIDVTDLTRTYGSFTAVDSISFRVERGSLFAFLGPNGAGKSTTISVLTTLAPAQSGSVTYSIIDEDPRLLGRDDAAIRSRIGVVFQDSLLDRPLSVRANLATRARWYGVDSIDDVCHVLRLDDLLPRTYGALSGGQRRRVDIARALLASPEILFLDEPTTGLDPQSRRLVWDAITSLREDLGVTVFLSTHDMDEAERADHVEIIDHGRIIASGTPAQLRAAYSRDRVLLRGPTSLEVALEDAGITWTRVRDVIEVTVADSAEAWSIINDHQGLIWDFEVSHGTMDDVFLNLTGTNLRED